MVPVIAHIPKVFNQKKIEAAAAAAAAAALYMQAKKFCTREASKVTLIV